MKIIVSLKCVYGNDLIYPFCDIAKEFSKLTGTRTFSKNQIDLIKKLGYKVEVNQVTI